MSRNDLSQMNESERQFYFIQELKKLDLFKINDFVSFEETNLQNLKPSLESDESEKSSVNDEKNSLIKEPSSCKLN